MIAGMAVVLMIALSVEAMAAMLCCVVHHGGNMIAAASAPAGSRNDNEAITSQLANSKPAGHSHVSDRCCTIFSPFNRTGMFAQKQ